MATNEIETLPKAGTTRRGFLALGAKSTVALALCELAPGLNAAFVGEVLAGTRAIAYAGWEDIYRKEWQWDKVTWGSHTNACSPGTCLFHVYTRNGLVWREEQAARTKASNPKYTDYNPLGCQKGCAFHTSLYSGERVKYPLKRVGERGEGKWQRISWDEALTAVADAILDAHQRGGTSSFVLDGPHVHAGNVASAATFRFMESLNGVITDHNMQIGDTFIGSLITLGKMQVGYTPDNFFDAQLVVMTHANWSYTAPALYHFLTEARYNGTEIAILAPDANTTTHAADIHIPVKVGTDAAFWLAACQVMIETGSFDAGFINEQTDLPLLVHTKTHRFLRAAEVDGGREDQLYFYDKTSERIAPAPRGTLRHEFDPALDGEYTVTLRDGARATVTPVFALLRRQLDQRYRPEQAQELCGVHASVIRDMAAKIASRRTCAYIGFSSGKHYHGDLMERSLLLAMALSGNVGKPGTGIAIWSFPADGISMLAGMERPIAQGGMAAGAEYVQALARELAAEDPEITEELVHIEMMKRMSRRLGHSPSAFWFYNHVGYDKLWNRREWQDPAMPRSFGDYMKEAQAKGWWDGLVLPPPGKPPEVLMYIGNNPLRRVRSGNVQYPTELFPKVKTIFTVETRLSSSAMYCDYVLPAAWYYEKQDMTLSMTASPYISLIEKATEPVGEAMEEWRIYGRLLKTIAERAAERGVESFVDRFGQSHRYADLYHHYTLGGAIEDHDAAVREMVAVKVATGIFPRDYSYDQFRRDGTVTLHGMGVTFQKHAVANEFDPKKPFYSLRWHTEEKVPYPTYARRMQFYIDHEWFLEVGEELPVHKDIPPIGGNYPFRITSGHPRISINSVHLANPQLNRLHRGQPVMFMNDADAAALGIADSEMVRVHNDVGAFEIMVSLQACVAPKQVIVYYWEPYQFRGWQNFDGVLVGMPKAIHFAGGYEQLRYFYMHGSPHASVDRGVRVGVEKLSRGVA